MQKYIVELDVKCWRTDTIRLEASSVEDAEARATKYWCDGPASGVDVINYSSGEATPADDGTNPAVCEAEQIAD